MKAMILAAGASGRLEGYQGGLPKPLLEVRGKTILERNLLYVRNAGIKDVYINLHHRADVIKGFLSQIKMDLNIHLCYEKKIMGTAGGIKRIQNELGHRTCLVLYGDNLTDLPLNKMRQMHRMRRADITVGMYQPGQSEWSGVGAGLININEKKRVIGFSEKTNNCKIDHDEWINAGVLLVSPRVLDLIPQDKCYDFSQDLMPKMLKQKKRIFGFSGAGYVLASDTVTTYKTTLKMAEKLKI